MNSNTTNNGANMKFTKPDPISHTQMMNSLHRKISDTAVETAVVGYPKLIAIWMKSGNEWIMSVLGNAKPGALDGLI
jgi:hypothetical protein